ncbi:MAG: nucleotidyl transferase AbiEii/AbiGii toxin family protein, partial [Rhodocyclaceae bacterium]|nr:nucleotidyl transferase AbiEii/AbiGii toxin family protein [Rhodocyclaceae bacterium]
MPVLNTPISNRALRQHLHEGSWRALHDVALHVVRLAERRAGGAPMSPRLGGGTCLMLQIQHRISHDIDLFVLYAQWMGYLTPRLS